ncbi:S10 family peptidase [Arundinibacter roseus]|uniref:Carboxypeptidase n=1 Tax=Arundinibacter roseus TaxID=2070510 RepID=A0A4R4KDY7_9BACT|nr:carboxypeptidase [Arundinibacter roseus]TDB65893.1 carboxypeptidase [Arundinibacter roseus]
MKKILLLLFIFLIKTANTNAQKPATPPAPKTAPSSTNSVKLEMDSTLSTSHVVTIKGVKVPYTAKVGTQPVWDENGKVIAGVFYTYYERTDVKDRVNRPLVISFNGGPGTASVWMHLAYTGPKLLNIDSEGYPLQPYTVKDNPNSILDVADIIFIDPVNTGYSRMADPKGPKSKFFGVNVDIKYLADWISTFVSRQNRWLSPKFIIGESYGTNRVSGLALELQNAKWMYLNGVILVSPTNLGIDRNGPVGAANMLPYYAATAWFHKVLPTELQQKDLVDMLPEVENFTTNELIPALAMGGFLEPQKKKEIAARIARYSGLSEKVVLEHNLQIPVNFFWKELLRDKGFTIGRLDSRYLGIDRQDAGERPDYSPELTSWLHSFTPPINYYFREVLGYKTDLKYFMFGPVYPWSRSGENTDRTGENLRQAMAQNPSLHLLVQSGYYDGACDYFNAQNNMWQMDPAGRLKDRMDWKGYRSGHMMYLRQEDLISANEDIRKFVQKALPKPGQPIKYNR